MAGGCSVIAVAWCEQWITSGGGSHTGVIVAHDISSVLCDYTIKCLNGVMGWWAEP